MSGLEQAILRTILYADVFHFPMRAEEIHHFLIYDRRVGFAAVNHTLATSPRLARNLCCEQGYYALADRSDIIALRLHRESATGDLWNEALRYGRWLARLPFVRMVALTGALAMHNADRDDDLDYMLVTEPGRVWLARLMAVALVRVVKLRGQLLCPNYVVAADALDQTRHDLFIAHEIVQMIPLYGQAHYDALRSANLWASDLLPNAAAPYHPAPTTPDGRGWRLAKSLLERLLGGRIGDRLETWEYRRKLRRFAEALQTPHSAAELDSRQVKGHFNDYGHHVMQAYYERLRAYDLVDLPQAGD